MNTSPSEMATKAAVATSCFLNMAAFFASPRVYAKALAQPSREDVLESIDIFLEIVELFKKNPQDSAMPFLRTESAVLELRELVLLWNPGNEPSPELLEKARTCLSLFGVPTPVEGWDRYEGPSPDRVE